MRLTSTAKDKIKQSHRIVGAVADTLSKHPDTIRRFIDNDDILLTHQEVLAVLSIELKCTQSELLDTKKKK